jgi:hypothetical protein
MAYEIRKNGLPVGRVVVAGDGKLEFEVTDRAVAKVLGLFKDGYPQLGSPPNIKNRPKGVIADGIRFIPYDDDALRHLLATEFPAGIDFVEVA